MKAIHMLYSGNFNSITTEVLPGDIHSITLHKDGDKCIYHLKVKHLYQVDEQVIEDLTIDTATPDHIAARVKEAQQHVGTD